MHIRDQKNELRDSILERLQHVDSKKKQAESNTLCRELLPHIPEDATICAYIAMRTEARLDLLIDTLLERDQSLFLPCFEDNKLVFRQCTDVSTLEKGKLGTMEPTQKDAQLDQGTENLIVLVPGLAFDPFGRRLGRSCVCAPNVSLRPPLKWELEN